MTQGTATSGRGTTSLREQPWWTDADQAELDLLAHEFARVAWIHKTRCSECTSTGRFAMCPRLTDGWNAVEEWRVGRVLRSKADWLRLQQRLRDFAA